MDFPFVVRVGKQVPVHTLSTRSTLAHNTSFVPSKFAISLKDSVSALAEASAARLDALGYALVVCMPLCMPGSTRV
ncbi:hypothetical protein EON66_02840 [archaeon]|nr:MAG: hypothetical protein EON66_02840 [archaeon]